MTNSVFRRVCPAPGLQHHPARQKLLRRGVNATHEQSMFQASACQDLCHFTDDHMEALNAMFEKRKPSFQGK